jgi:hypothetical protein
MPDLLTRLTNLRITRVAMVPEGDNPEAHIVLWKSRPEVEAKAAAAPAPAGMTRSGVLEVFRREARRAFPGLVGAAAEVAFVEGERGRALMAAYRSASPDPQSALSQKERDDAESELRKIAAERAERDGMSVEAAMTKIVQTPEGRAAHLQASGRG